MLMERMLIALVIDALYCAFIGIIDIMILDNIADISSVEVTNFNLSFIFFCLFLYTFEIQLYCGLGLVYAINFRESPWSEKAHFAVL